MIQRHLTMSEPEGRFSDFSSYEELSSNSDSESEELSISINKGNKNEVNSNDEKNRRKFSNTSTVSYYRSWHLRRASKSSINNSENFSNEKKSIDSTDSLTSLVEVEKNWWYWTKLAVFISTPFIARQLGIFLGKRILVRLFRDMKI